jgi:hypothetical protein
MRKLLVLLTILPMCFSCSSDEGTLETNKDFVNAEVIYTGEPEVDGCGYMLKIEDDRYKPVNLPSQYQQHKLQVMIIYQEDPAGYLCGDLPYPIATIEILDIIKK